MSDRVTITNPFVGICHMQLCVVADATDEEILVVANGENPSGTTAGWGRVIRDGEGAPVPCEGLGGGARLHVLAVC